MELEFFIALLLLVNVTHSISVLKDLSKESSSVSESKDSGSKESKKNSEPVYLCGYLSTSQDDETIIFSTGTEKIKHEEVEKESHFPEIISHNPTEDVLEKYYENIENHYKKEKNMEIDNKNQEKNIENEYSKGNQEINKENAYKKENHDSNQENYRNYAPDHQVFEKYVPNHEEFAKFTPNYELLEKFFKSQENLETYNSNLDKNENYDDVIDVSKTSDISYDAPNFANFDNVEKLRKIQLDEEEDKMRIGRKNKNRGKSRRTKLKGEQEVQKSFSPSPQVHGDIIETNNDKNCFSCSSEYENSSDDETNSSAWKVIIHPMNKIYPFKYEYKSNQLKPKISGS